jgi:dimethylglycine dehydrogenase
LGGFSKYDVQGEGTSEWLDSLIAGKLPRLGRLSLSYFCAEDGGVWSEMTLTRLADEHFLLITAGAAKWHDFQWLEEHLPQGSGISIKDISDDVGTLVLAGPRSREVLQQLTNTDLSNEAFRWLTYQEIQLSGITVRALRVNYVGELGWELHVKTDDHLALYEALMKAGESYNLKDFGMYAMESMRLEKSYRAWKAELDHEYSPLRSSLNRFVDLTKAEFKGKAALVAEAAKPLPDVFATLVLDPYTESETINKTDALYGCPIFVDDENVGYTTSGGYGHRIEKSVALSYVKPELAAPGTKLQVKILGVLRNATVVAESPYDRDNVALRS